MSYGESNKRRPTQNEKTFATITTTKEEIITPGMGSKLSVSEPATSKPSPKIYDLITPLKRSKKGDRDSYKFSDMLSDIVSKIDDAKDGAHKRGKKATTSAKLASKML